MEKHFEQLLARQDLEIKIIYEGKEEIAQAFNYDSFLGTKIEKDIAELSIEKRGVMTKQTLRMPVKIFLKITDDIIPNKRPIFVNKRGSADKEIKGSNHLEQNLNTEQGFGLIIT